MDVEYRLAQPKTSKTEFVIFHPSQRQQILDEITEWLLICAEASVKGTDLDRELWSTVTEADKTVWRRAQAHLNQPNTMLSVVSGSISKMRSGGDLTTKQFENIRNADLVMSHYQRRQPWQWRPVEEFSGLTARQRLQEKLFDYE